MGRNARIHGGLSRRRLLTTSAATAAGLTLAGNAHLRRMTVAAQGTPAGDQTGETVAIVGDVVDVALDANGR